MDIERSATVDLEVLGEELRVWFIERSWNINIDKNPSTYVIQATKAGKVRRVFAACRALVVICRHEEGKTRISVRQGRWTENIWSNLESLILIGGMNLGFTLWSFEVQREFQHFAKKALEMQGVSARAQSQS
jgi:hypothetical protein